MHKHKKIIHMDGATQHLQSHQLKNLDHYLENSHSWRVWGMFVFEFVVLSAAEQSDRSLKYKAIKA